MKRALVTRYGAFGDAIMVSPLFRILKEDGYRVVANVNPRTADVLRHNPHIDEYMIHPDHSVPMDKLEEHWKSISAGFDKFINLSGSIEGGLLRMPGDSLYSASHMERHLSCNVNYYDRTLDLAGYGHIKGRNGELYFDGDEISWGTKIMNRHKDKFVVLWSLSGSSPHKVYPYAELVANEFLKAHRDALIYTVGDASCAMLEFLDLDKIKGVGELPYQRMVEQFAHPQVKRRSGMWSIRHSFVMAKMADCVVGTETGVMNAAGCFKTPKVVILSHSSHENLSKYWENVYPMEAKNSEAPCHPCHKMIYSVDSCMKNSTLNFSICQAHLRPQLVFGALEDIYQKWKAAKYGSLRV